MITLSTNINYNGQCEAAFKFYEKILGAKITFLMRWGESPMGKDVSRDWANKIIHGTITVGERTLSGSDAPQGRYEKPQGVQMILDISDATEAERIYKLLSEKGTVHMPLAETFWAKRFGMLSDQFGTPWMINCGKPM